jgi:hypothetical protein
MILMKTLIAWLIENKYNIDEKFTYGNIINARRVVGNIEYWLKIKHSPKGYECEYIEWASSSYGKRIQSNLIAKYQDVITFFKSNIR